MLTYDLKKMPGLPLYEGLYRCIRGDILSGRLPRGSRLPSKRALAAHLGLSKITVESAYNRLAAEGYIAAREKVGYFVEPVEVCAPAVALPAMPETPEMPLLDLTANVPAQFPFSVWSRCQRRVLQTHGHALLRPLPSQGCLELRQAIARHLADFRGMQVDPAQIIIGAGTDFLYNLVPQLLGQDRCYALEEPGYGKIRRIYQAAGAKTVPAAMDAQGVIPAGLQGADVLHFSPSHHFPSGIVTPKRRRQQLLQWASQGKKWIIEDDYDCEFRFDTHPMPALFGQSEQVLYINSFSKSLAPSIRMGYMVLPWNLLAVFREKLGFYGCTVSVFEQQTLALFLQEGHFERHINRMRKFYRLRRNALLQMIYAAPGRERLAIEEADAGLHFLLKIQTEMPDEALEAYCRSLGVKAHTLSRYYTQTPPPERMHRLVINYSGLKEEDMGAFSKFLGNF